MHAPCISPCAPRPRASPRAPRPACHALCISPRAPRPVRAPCTAPHCASPRAPPWQPQCATLHLIALAAGRKEAGRAGAAPATPSRTITAHASKRSKCDPCKLEFLFTYCEETAKCFISFECVPDIDRLVLLVDVPSETLELRVLRRSACPKPPGRIIYFNDPMARFGLEGECERELTTGGLALGKCGAPHLLAECYVVGDMGGEIVKDNKGRTLIRFRHTALEKSGWLTQYGSLWRLEVQVRQPVTFRSLPLATLRGDFDNSPTPHARARPSTPTAACGAEEDGGAEEDALLDAAVYDPKRHPAREERHLLRDPRANDSEHPENVDMTTAADAALGPVWASSRAAAEEGPPNPPDIPPDAPPSPPDSEDDAEEDAEEDLPEKVLDKIVDEQLWQGRLYYRVAWEGGAHPDEWVPADHDAWLDGTTTNVLPIWQAHKATQRPLDFFSDVSDKSAD